MSEGETASSTPNAKTPSSDTRTYVVESSMQDYPYDVSHVPIDYENQDDVKVKQVGSKSTRNDGGRELREEMIALEKDVARLQKKLTQEVNLRNALHRGLNRPLGALPRVPNNLPVETRELLLEVAVLEEEVVSLEKRTMYLREEIEDEVPLTTEQMFWHLLPPFTPSPLKPELAHKQFPQAIPSSLETPRTSTDHRSNAPKQLTSPRKSTDHRSNPSMPLTPQRNTIDQRSVPSKPIISPRKSTEYRSIPSKSSIPLRNSSDARGIPSKPSIFLRNSTDQRNVSSIPFATKNEPHDAYVSATTRAASNIPTTLTIPEVNVVWSPPASSLSKSPTELSNGCVKQTWIKSEASKPPITTNTRPKPKDPLVAKMLPPIQASKAPSTLNRHNSHLRPTNSTTAAHSPRLPRQTQIFATVVAPRRTTHPTVSVKQGSEGIKKPSELSGKGTSPRRDSSPKRPVVVQGGSFDATSLSKNDFVDECKPFRKISPHHVKDTQNIFTTEEDLELDLEQITDSGMLSEELVKLLTAIYGNMQQVQPPLTSDSGASSRASMSTSNSSMSPENFETKSGASAKFLQECYSMETKAAGASLKFLEECYGESFQTKRGASLKFMQECYSGEVADTLDPYGILRRGIRSPTPFQQRLKS